MHVNGKRCNETNCSFDGTERDALVLLSSTTAMSYYPPQQYTQYQPQQQYAAQHSATQYTPYQSSGQPQAGTSTAYPVYSPAAFKTSSPPSPDLTRVEAPVFPDVTPEIAAQAIQRLAASELRHAGFDRAEPAALTLLELECVGCVYSSCLRPAHEHQD